MKFNTSALLLGISTSIAGILLLGSIPSLASPIKTTEYSNSNAASQPTMTESATENTTDNTIQGQSVTTEQDSETTTNQPVSRTRTERQRAWENLGVCRAYVSPSAEPDSFEYREGLDKCWYGSD